MTPAHDGGASVKTREIAVLVPCYNEGLTIGKVVQDFRAALPHATIYVYDNNSKDDTAAAARAAGAIVRTERLQGKGNVVRRMFADVDADIYVLVDGDDTYDAASAPRLVEQLIAENLDMLNAARVSTSELAYRRGHKFGNWMLTSLVASIFQNRFADMLSGYRVFSHRFVNSFPVVSGGFEIETELTVHALEMRMPVAEMPTPYKERPEGSVSKLSTYRDGVRILWLILHLVKQERPQQFFSGLAVLLSSISLLLGIPIIVTYMETGLVPRLPTALLSTGMMVLAFLSLISGFILDTVTRGRQEVKRLHYLLSGRLRNSPRN